MLPNDSYLFLNEFESYIQKINEALFRIEKTKGSTEDINDLFRSFHTLKGNAGIFGHDELKEICKYAEDHLSEHRNNNTTLSSKELDVYFDVSSLLINIKETIAKEQNTCFKETIEKIFHNLFPLDLNLPANINKTKIVNFVKISIFFKDQNKFIAVDIDDILSKIILFSNDITSNNNFNNFNSEKAKLPLTINIPEEIFISQKDNIVFFLTKNKNVQAYKIVYPIQIDTFGQKTELLIKDTSKELTKLVISIRKLDRIISNLTEIITISKPFNQNLQILKENNPDPLLLDLEKKFKKSIQLASQTKKEIINIRTIPLRTITDKYPLLVRELAKTLNKKINISITGAELSYDRTIINNLNEILIHLIRNSVDHGIEPPSIRKKTGKNEFGNIILQAFQNGDKLNIIFSDDGSGIDLNSIKNTLITNKMFTKSKLSKLSSEQLVNFIFHPGFSTKNQVTELSGRGVGMDVVSKSLEKLQASITIQTTSNEGTSFRISLPTNISLTRGITFIRNNQHYIISTNYIKEIVSAKNLSQKTILLIDPQNGETINLQKILQSIPNLKCIVIDHESPTLAIIAEKILYEQELNHKNIDFINDLYYLINSATLLNNGEIGLIINISELLKKYRGAYENTSL